MTIAIALSGGVDSSVAAFLLKEKGYDLIAATIKMWDIDKFAKQQEIKCGSNIAIEYARDIANGLNIPYYIFDCSLEFINTVKKNFIDEHKRARTPNPCIICNKEVKFGVFFDKVKEFKTNRVATGHYAKIIKSNDNYYLSEAKDKTKDQSYFLYAIDINKLHLIDFPIGEYTKKEVRDIAIKNNLVTAFRSSSQDICFAAFDGGYREYMKKNNLGLFLSGDILNVFGKIIGKHKGLSSYTIGQRKGIGIADKNPLYVLKMDINNNTIIVGNKKDAMQKKIRINKLNWLIRKPITKMTRLKVKIRYNGEKIESFLIPETKERIVIEFIEKQFAPTIGQSAVFYDGEIVIGGGYIEEVLE